MCQYLFDHARFYYAGNCTRGALLGAKTQKNWGRLSLGGAIIAANLPIKPKVLKNTWLVPSRYSVFNSKNTFTRSVMLER
ncbi:hypothetical protein GLIP_0077 [Aliiglaciecola lipolytica E3]|uniref:Uncharacterized protein n=1 Tax=Aliiglaciecola lipolytica E3 TaxID=1127673 RepID=K6Y387_9ALTE|nr:hypothetical protein GLIP_0077 [Aliiglaciecola lipolytica E3]